MRRKYDKTTQNPAHPPKPDVQRDEEQNDRDNAPCIYMLRLLATPIPDRYLSPKSLDSAMRWLCESQLAPVILEGVNWERGRGDYF